MSRSTLAWAFGGDTRALDLARDRPHPHPPILALECTCVFVCVVVVGGGVGGWWSHIAFNTSTIGSPYNILRSTSSPELVIAFVVHDSLLRPKTIPTLIT